MTPTAPISSLPDSWQNSDALADETRAVQQLLDQARPIIAHEQQIYAYAESLVKRLRVSGPDGGMESFLQEYGLDTREGIAVMCLAEALLRIPDNATAHALLKDKFQGAEWDKYIGKSDSLFVNASSFGLLLAGKVVEWGKKDESAATVLTRLINKYGEPVVLAALRRAMRILGDNFVLGETIEAALEEGKKLEKQAYLLSFDMLGEGARSKAQADRYIQSYFHAIDAVGGAINPGTSFFKRANISIKLSALHPRYEMLKSDRLVKELVPTLAEIISKTKHYGMTLVIDAEEASRLDISLMVLEKLLRHPVAKRYDGVGLAIQAYQKRAPEAIDHVASLGKATQHCIPVRLVKGAYWDGEIKKAQQYGLRGFPVYTQKHHTDLSYLVCAEKLLKAGARFYPQFATHNAVSIASVLALAGEKEFEFQRLHGMGKALYDIVLKERRVDCRVYAPVGTHKDLLSYLIRRLLENGANTSFVHHLADQDTPLEHLLESPIMKTQKMQAMPVEHIALPEKLYGAARRNSLGFDPGYRAMLEEMVAALKPWENAQWKAAPVISGQAVSGQARTRMEPANVSRPVGQAADATPEQAHEAIAAAQAAQISWAHRPVKERADILNAIANLFARHRPELLALIMREAGKTLGDAMAELREAEDFCRYYATEAVSLMETPRTLPGPAGELNQLSLHARGAFVCISPWNFPLAIFTGQVVAALVTGNAVLAKPAEQTPLIAARAVQLMHEAGIPHDILHLLPGGAEIGKALVANPRIAGVCFTGSTEGALHINRALAAKNGPITPLIAETGGQNAMVIDSSALLEQTVDDMVISAFGSTGQRCSALRVAFVQEEVAEELLALLAGAMDELAIGNPWNLANDLGPVIDEEARAKLTAHIDDMRRAGKMVKEASLSPSLAATGHYVAPCVIELPSLAMLTREHFGPILHIVRYKANEMDRVVAAINATGYGLTLGIQSRIQQTGDAIAAKAKAGNIYVNRSMIGAVVGVQPFGGEGLSGTGPKAGGPFYLPRFCTERTYTQNTAAVGGNIDLFR